MSGSPHPSSSSSSSSMTIDIRPMIEDVSQVMTKHITSILSGVIGEYNIYKETHDTIMGLPCVRKLHERIAELEDGTTTNTTTARTTCANSREDEISQLQGAISDLNRYIRALESKVDMKSVVAIKEEDEESVKLEIREEEESGSSSGDDTDDVCIVSSTHKNVIISAAAAVSAPVVEAEEAEAEEAEAEEAEAEAEEEEAEAEEEEAEEAEAEEAEAEDTEAEAEEEEADADAEEAEEAEDAEADAEAEEAEAEEAEIEVSEVKIKGKTYFTTDAQNGIIYACVDDDVGDEVGVFKNGVAVFNKGKK